MQCPKCQAEIIEGHFYCSNCCSQVLFYEPIGKKSGSGRFERAGKRALIALLYLSLITALVMIGRMAVWRELFAAIRGDMPTSVKAESESKVKPAARLHSAKGRPEGRTTKESNDKSQKDTKVAKESGEEKKDKKDTGEEKKDKVEAQADSGQKIENPNPVKEQPLPQKQVEPTSQKVSGETGVVIRSDSPARIYINGQFSGTTPQTIKLNPGDFQIRLIADGYDEWTRRVRVKNKQQVEISASMKKKPSQK